MTDYIHEIAPKLAILLGKTWGTNFLWNNFNQETPPRAMFIKAAGGQTDSQQRWAYAPAAIIHFRADNPVDASADAWNAYGKIHKIAWHDESFSSFWVEASTAANPPQSIGQDGKGYHEFVFTVSFDIFTKGEL